MSVTWYRCCSGSKIFFRPTAFGANRWPSFARITPFLKTSSSSVGAGSSSPRQASIHLRTGGRIYPTTNETKNRDKISYLNWPLGLLQPTQVLIGHILDPLFIHLFCCQTLNWKRERERDLLFIDVCEPRRRKLLHYSKSSFLIINIIRYA